LFNIFIEIIVARALNDVDVGVVLRKNMINNLRFADDSTAVTENEYYLQLMVNGIERESCIVGMKNVDKTEIQLI